MNDIDLIFTDIDDINTRLYDLETIHTVKEYNTMTQTLEYGLVVAGGSITATPAETYTVTQYQEIIIKSTVSGLVGTNKTVKLSISSPDYASGSETEPSDFEYTIHMTPTTEGKEIFELRLTELLGSSLTIGVLNTCSIMFSIVSATGDEYLSALSTFALYKTNTDLSYAPSDVTAAFIKLGELNKRVVELESE